VPGVPEKAFVWSVTVPSKKIYSQCNMPTQIEQAQDICNYGKNSCVKGLKVKWCMLLHQKNSL